MSGGSLACPGALPLARPSSRPALFSRSLQSLRAPLACGSLLPQPARVAGGVRCRSAAADVSEEHTYQAEVDRLLDMIVNSLYSNREVFVRELVSNASDALDKMRLQALQSADEYKTGEALEIRISCDRERREIVIEDTGVGMTKEDLVSSLGTIARSGTAKFMEALKDKGDANLIGQFGVGFYSAFLVADRVTVQTKSNRSDVQWRWESAAGAHSYRVSQEPEGDLRRGTRVTLHLKEDALDLADARKLSELVKQYSEFIAFPIKLWQSRTDSVRVVDEEATQKARAEAEAKAVAEGGEAAEVEPVYRTEEVSKQDWEVQNDSKPLWTRAAKDTSREEQNAFFRSTFKEFVDPLAVAQFSVEGTFEFASILCVPGMPPFDQSSLTSKPRNIRLYVKRVFISDEFDGDLLPRWAGFVKGVVDSQDLPLNVSREILQESRVVRAIRRQLVKRTLDMLSEVAARPERREYAEFWEGFGRYLKVGAIEDAANRADLAKLLRFQSSATAAQGGEEGALTSLAEYVSRMQEGQTQIYFLVAPSRAAAEQSPFAEGLRSKGLEVLYLLEPVDEIVVMNLAQFDGKQFADVSREDVQAAEQSDESKKSLEEASEALAPLTSFVKNALGDRVEKVVVSSRLTDSPAMVVLSKHGWSSNMERIARAQSMGEPREAEYMRGRRILEINPDHAVVRHLKDLLQADEGAAREHVQLLYDAAALAGGYDVEAPREFAARVYRLLAGDGGVAGAAGKPIQAEVVV